MKRLMTPLFVSMLFLHPLISQAQRAILSAGPEIAFPGSKNGISDNKKTGLGGSFRLESLCGEHLSFVFTGGYISFGESKPYTAVSTTHKVYAIPLQLGYKCYLHQQKEIPQGFFVSAEAGVVIAKDEIKYLNGKVENYNESGFGAAFGAGYLHKQLDIGLRFQYNLQQTGYNVYYYNIRVAYAIYAKKKKG